MLLNESSCVPCEEGGPPMDEAEARTLLAEIPSWTLWPDSRAISKSYTFRNFKDAFAFAGRIAEIAEKEGHHPDLMISWGRVEIELSTHSIGGLSRNDFILAAKIDVIG